MDHLRRDSSRGEGGYRTLAQMTDRDHSGSCGTIVLPVPMIEVRSRPKGANDETPDGGPGGTDFQRR